jgi:predicted metalloprotease with PDZ domain
MHGRQVTQQRRYKRTPMKLPAAIAILGTALVSASYAAPPGANQTAGVVPVPVPSDRPYRGEIRLEVDASDVERRVVHVNEHVSGIDHGTVLLFPKWLPGNHSMTGPIERFAGLKISANGAPVSWTRDLLDMYAFHVHAPAAVSAIDVTFDYLSPTSSKIDPLEMSRDLIVLDWNSVLLYPAGYFVRRIPVVASLRVPEGWLFGTALEPESSGAGGTVFKNVNVETLVDSPVYAGRYGKRVDLDPGSKVPVTMNLFADRPELLEVNPEQIEAHRALVQQAYRLFASHHYAHYDFLYALSDQLAEKGVEHHQSSEDTSDPTTFTDWEKTAYERDLLPHEFTHSWNGKFRRPADLWTPNYNVPMRDSLLWVYEGQTEYWGDVLAARSGLWSHQQAIDELALVAAQYEMQPGRQWRPLQDTTNDPIINHHHPRPWSDWTRYKDYYDEGVLIWLDADTLIRERSNGTRALDDFARAFFGINDGSTAVVTYTFDDVVKALNTVQPYDWATFLHRRLDGVGIPAPLDGLRRGGYRLVYTEKPNDFQKDADGKLKQTDLIHSIGVIINDKDGSVLVSSWGSPAFRAGLTEATQILAVNGIAYDPDVLGDAIRAAKSTRSPIELIVKIGDRFRLTRLEYYDGLRYPHLERDPAVPARLDEILAERKL